ncbi:hypothetical protein [Nocardioides nanhaiensis]
MSSTDALPPHLEQAEDGEQPEEPPAPARRGRWSRLLDAGALADRSGVPF